MSNKNKYDGLKVERVYTSDALKDLVRENAELKAFVNAPFTKGSKTTRGDYIKTVWDLSKQLDKAKELLAKWVELFKPKGGNIPPTPIQVDTEQFLNGEVEK